MCVAWSASGKRLASGDEEGVVKIWHIDEPVVRLAAAAAAAAGGQCVCYCVTCGQLARAIWRLRNHGIQQRPAHFVQLPATYSRAILVVLLLILFSCR
jgi:hypothetical protein